MSGPNSLLLDTNAVIALLKGDAAVADHVANTTAVYVSVISVIEFLSYRELSDADQHSFRIFLDDCFVIGLDDGADTVVIEAAQLRRTLGLRLPDAVIAASAGFAGASILTRDRHFERVPNLQVLNY